MNEREALRNSLMDSGSDVNSYVLQRRKIEEAVINSFNTNPTGSMSVLLETSVNSASRYLNPNSPATVAAMYMAAIAYRAYLYSDDDKTPKKSFSQIWRGTPVEKLTEKSEQMAEGIQPTTQGSFVNIDLQAHRQAFGAQIDSGNSEGIILTGLNGVGKTTMLKSVVKYLEICGLSTEVIKFPRSNGLLGEVILNVLSGNEKISASSLQYLMVADALDDNGTSDTDALRVYDRHPIVDSLVYGPPNTQIPMLASRELFQNPNWIIVIDRHPVAAKAVKDRQGSKRIFEQKLEQMVDQVIRYAALTALPGCRWINNDVPSGQRGDYQEDWCTEVSKRRVVGSLRTSGVVNRALVRQNIEDSVKNADDHASNIYWQRIDEWLAG